MRIVRSGLLLELKPRTAQTRLSKIVNRRVRLLTNVSDIANSFLSQPHDTAAHPEIGYQIPCCVPISIVLISGGLSPEAQKGVNQEYSRARTFQPSDHT